MKKTIPVMLVEDHPEYRDVIDLALKDAPGIKLTHKVGSAERAIRVLMDQPQAEAPDVILLDLNLPGKSGLDALPTLRSSHPNIKIVLLTQSDSKPDVLQAMQLGAVGYILKSSTVQQIIEAIHTVASGGVLLGSGVANFILDAMQSQPPADQLDLSLSARELQILSLLGEGKLKKEIASELEISIATVATYIRRIYEKLDVQNAPAAVAKAYRSGVLPKDTNDDNESNESH